MKTETRTPNRDVLSPWLTRPAAPWVAVVLMAGVFWVAESAVHVVFFDPSVTFVRQLVAPAPHELWMRVLVAAMIGGLGAAWYLALLERRRRIESMSVYQGKLQDLAGRLAAGDSEERREFARRLHEDIGQQLSAARMFVSSADDSALEADHVRTVARILDRAITECRELAEELSPPVLEEFGLVPALRSLASRIMRRTGISVQVDASHACLGLQRESLLITFHVLAEVVEAAAERVETTRISIGCDADDGTLTFRVHWNGSGGDEFFSASERIASLGGRTDLSGDAVSTTFTAHVPAAA